MRVPGPGERRHLGSQRLLDRLEAERNERLDHRQRHERGERALVERHRLLRRGWVRRMQPLVPGQLPSYSCHGWCPRERVRVLGRITRQ